MYFNGEVDFLKTKFSYNEDSRPKNSIFTFAALNYYISDASNSIALLENDPDAYIQKALNWFGFDLDDTETVDENPRHQNAAIEQLQALLEETESKPLNSENWADFREEFRTLYEKSGGATLCSGKAKRKPGTHIIVELLASYGYQVKTNAKLKLKYIVKEDTKK